MNGETRCCKNASAREKNLTETTCPKEEEIEA